MLDIFELLFKDKGVPEAEVRRFASEFSGLALCAILGEAQSKWAPEDSEELEKLLIVNDFDGAYRLAQNKFSPEEFRSVLARKVAPLFEDYVASVAN